MGAVSPAMPPVRSSADTKDSGKVRMGAVSPAMPPVRISADTKDSGNGAHGRGQPRDASGAGQRRHQGQRQGSHGRRQPRDAAPLEIPRSAGDASPANSARTIDAGRSARRTPAASDAIPTFGSYRGALACKRRNRKSTRKPMILVRFLNLKFLRGLAARR